MIFTNQEGELEDRPVAREREEHQLRLRPIIQLLGPVEEREADDDERGVDEDENERGAEGDEIEDVACCSFMRILISTKIYPSIWIIT